MPSSGYRFLVQRGACKFCGWSPRHFDGCPVGKEVGYEREDATLDPEWPDEPDDERYARFREKWETAGF